jgi:hypothetical protein
MALKLQELSAQIAAISQQLNNGSGGSVHGSACTSRTILYSGDHTMGKTVLLLIMQRAVHSRIGYSDSIAILKFFKSASSTAASG